MKPILMVLAAGMGSRFGGLKQVEPVGPAGEAVLDYSVFDALRAGFGRAVFVIRREMETLFRERVLARFSGRIECALAYQELDGLPDGFAVPDARQKPWGTAHAILCAREQVDTPFLAINADDFYGADAFAAMAGFLQGAAGAWPVHRFAMAAYPLGATLSEHGSVARGVCEVDADDRLAGIVERTGIARIGDRIVWRDPAGTEVELRADQPVSMNFWGLMPGVFPMIEEQFRVFLRAHASEPKAEFYIPSAVCEMVRTGRCTVEVLRTPGNWFGVTYRADQPAVVAAISGMVGRGEYPAPLWQ